MKKDIKSKKLAVAFTGPSNSGKTTLIVKLSEILIEKGFKVCVVKHDPKDKARFDKEGKDSYKFTQTGADVAVVSPNKTTVFKQSPSSIYNIINLFEEFDYLFIEGLKTIPLPRIAVFRNSLDENYFEVTDAIATDETILKEQIPKSCEHLDLNDLGQIIKWIDKKGLKV